MTTYQLVPYLVKVHLTRKRDETRPLDDLHGGREGLAREVAELLYAHRGGLRVEPLAASPGLIQVESVKASARTLYTEVAPGRSGIESKIRKETGEEIDRGFRDHELIGIRHVLYYPGNGHRAILLAERIGGAGAIGVLTKLLKAAWKSRYPDTAVDISPALSEQALSGALAEQPIKSIQLTRPDMPNGLIVGGIRSTFRTEIRPQRSKRWEVGNFLGKGSSNNESLSAAILSEVTPILRPDADPHAAARAMLENEGWQVAVTLKLPGGTERTINVESTTAVSMSLPIIEDDEEPDHRPTADEFVAACRRVIADGLLDPWGIHPASAAACTWPDVEWDDPGDWKAVWDVSQPTPNSAGSLP